MTDIQRINITLPKKLVKRTRVLIDEGLYTNFSELVRESLKQEILKDQPLLDKKRVLDEWFSEKRSYDTHALSNEQLMERIRQTRNNLWAEKAEKWFEKL